MTIGERITMFGSTTRRALAAVLMLIAISSQSYAQGRPGQPKMEAEVFLETDAAHAGTALRVAVKATLGPKLHANSNKPLEDFLIPTVLSFEAQDGFIYGDVIYPEAKNIRLVGADTDMAVYEESFYLGSTVQIADTVQPGSYTLKGTIRYQACDEKQCYAPSKVEFTVPITVVDKSTTLNPQHADVFGAIAFTQQAIAPATTPTEATAPAPTSQEAIPTEDVTALLKDFKIRATGGYMNADEFLAFLSAAESGNAPTSATGMFEGKGPLFIALLTLLGGLALNLTPCVLPLIPINLMIIGAGAKASSRGRGFALGGVYGLGMAIAYGALGLIVVLTTASFGGINASPWFNFAIAVLFVVLALAMFDVVHIDFTRFQTKLGIKKKEGGSYVVAFLMGIVSALLAGACVAPVVIAVVLYSRDLYATGSAFGIFLPFLLGIGMALPWPIAGAGLSMLPKPGKWMNRVKYAFGVGILVLAGYYGYLGYGLFSERYLVDRAEVQASAEEITGEGWTTSLGEGLARAKAENKLVLVDVWATWCKNCLIMNKTTLKDPRVIAQLDNYIKVKYQAELPDESPHKEVLANFPDLVGLPYFVVLKPE